MKTLFLKTSHPQLDLEKGDNRMADRADKLLSAVQPELEAKMQQTIERIVYEFDAKREEIVVSFESAFKGGLDKVAAAQPQKGKVRRIHISYLLSSLLVGKYEFRVDFYNKDLYFDETETEFYWSAGFITSSIQEDFEYFQKLLKKTLIRVKDYEVQNMVVDFGVFYLCALTFYWPEIISSLPFQEYAHLFEERIEIVYGGFQDRSVSIAVIDVQEDLPCAIS